MTNAERITELEALVNGQSAWMGELAKQINEAKNAFHCFKCSDGNTPLYCLNCATKGKVDVGELKATIELLRDMSEKAGLALYFGQRVRDELARLEGIVAGDDVNWSDIATNFEEASTKVEAERDKLQVQQQGETTHKLEAELARLRTTVQWLRHRLPAGAWSMPEEISQTLAALQQQGETTK
jgi:hypothetical protein